MLFLTFDHRFNRKMNQTEGKKNHPQQKQKQQQQHQRAPKCRKKRHRINKMHAKGIHSICNVLVHFEKEKKQEERVDRVCVCAKETREDTLLWVFCTYMRSFIWSVCFFSFFLQCSIHLFLLHKTTYYGYINILNSLIMQNEWPLYGC